MEVDGARGFFGGCNENVLRLDYGDGRVLCKLIAQSNRTTNIR